jgi:hypothetical protein
MLTLLNITLVIFEDPLRLGIKKKIPVDAFDYLTNGKYLLGEYNAVRSDAVKCGRSLPRIVLKVDTIFSSETSAIYLTNSFLV